MTQVNSNDFSWDNTLNTTNTGYDSWGQPQTELVDQLQQEIRKLKDKIVSLEKENKLLRTTTSKNSLNNNISEYNTSKNDVKDISNIYDKILSEKNILEKELNGIYDDIKKLFNSELFLRLKNKQNEKYHFVTHGKYVKIKYNFRGKIAFSEPQEVLKISWKRGTALLKPMTPHKPTWIALKRLEPCEKTPKRTTSRATQSHKPSTRNHFAQTHTNRHAPKKSVQSHKNTFSTQTTTEPRAPRFPSRHVSKSIRKFKRETYADRVKRTLHFRAIASKQYRQTPSKYGPRTVYESSPLNHRNVRELKITDEIYENDEHFCSVMSQVLMKFPQHLSNISLKKIFGNVKNKKLKKKFRLKCQPKLSDFDAIMKGITVKRKKWRKKSTKKSSSSDNVSTSSYNSASTSD